MPEVRSEISEEKTEVCVKCGGKLKEYPYTFNICKKCFRVELDAEYDKHRQTSRGKYKSFQEWKK